MITYLCLFVCVVGLFLYAIFSVDDAKAKMATLGKIMFACGLLVFLFLTIGKHVSFP